ncbi:helix-turn-helix transcriptional regulator (plasmid) [Phyllobacterium sp. 628]|uniref:helix-turn-helix transcriptional regulator n=1 Tax=Phyllobacterium sp. 628 TaxID=2718938 RepID=UPI0016626866|nr:AraC family transcriptional regulator [Phyllobacterium sp. 628]QND54994.1 helix-turn-helix transcriptional regulator [Phyllobacterium sp. 628]
MSEFEVSDLLDTGIVSLQNVRCSCTCRHRSAEECTSTTYLVFPYRGIYIRHVGGEQAVADANHVLFFNSGEAYQVSHPINGGDASLSVGLSESVLRELVPRSLLNNRAELGFRLQSQRIDPRAQALVALLRYHLENGTIEPLEAESLLLTLICRSFGPRTSHESRSTFARSRLADRVKVLLASDLSRRWTLNEIAAEIGGSPVYLTQVFQQVEGIPLYRYHLRLRLARALDLITHYDDLSALALELGFSSHSHFTAAFRQAYGRSPTAFTQTPRHSQNS